MNDYKPRFSFEITPEQAKRVSILLSTYGIRRNIFSPILDDLLDLIEEYGNVVVGVLLDEQAKPRDVVPSLRRAAEKGEKQ